mgnify:CR=1 FL=1
MSGRDHADRRAGALSDRRPGRPDVATDPPPLRHPGLRRQRLHRRPGGQAGGRGAPRGGRARGAVRRPLRPRALHARRRGARRARRHARPLSAGTPRGAVAAEPGTTVLGIGAKPGEVFEPSGWEWTFAGMSLLSQGQEEAARREFDAGIEAYPNAWQGYYNLACVEAKLGNRELGARPAPAGGARSTRRSSRSTRLRTKTSPC